MDLFDRLIASVCLSLMFTDLVGISNRMEKVSTFCCFDADSTFWFNEHIQLLSESVAVLNVHTGR